MVERTVFRPIVCLILTLILSSRALPAVAATDQSNPPNPPEIQKEEAGSEPVRIEYLIEQMLAVNPELQAARKPYEAALPRPAQERALPDPRITAGWISNGWPYPGAGL